jgi:aminocarboxymuconate-semialdehyde decarboxylase
LRDSLSGDPVLAARRMYYDDLVYDADTIHRLIQVFGVSQILAGSDYPFVIQDADPAARLRALGLPDSALQLLRSGNAERWLGLGPQASHTQETP